MATQSDEWLTLGEVSQQFGVSLDAIRRRVDSGVLAAYAAPFDGRKMLFKRSDLEKMTAPAPLPRRRQKRPRSASMAS